MLSDLDRSFYPHLATGALWHGVPSGDTEGALTLWQWTPHVWMVVDGTLDHLNQLIEVGWECVGRWPTEDRTDVTVVQLWGQLADIRLVQMPGQSDREVWARSKDIAQVRAQPVTLAFNVPETLQAAATSSTARTHVLRIAEVIPPPQFGELGIVVVRQREQLAGGAYELSDIGEEGLELWRRMGAGLKALAAPAEWWPQTPRLEACIRGEYTELREALRSKLLDTRGQERELWRSRLAELEIDRKHAQALRTARDRVLKDPATWLEQWQEVRQMAAQLAGLYWQAYQRALSVPAMPVFDTELDETLPQPEPLAMDAEGALILAQLIEANSATSMDTTSYAEDRAIREASLAPKGKWQAEADVPRYNASNNLAVYFLDREHPLSLAEAQAQLLRIRESTVLTVRIAQGLWNMRRNNAQLARNGAAAIRYDEILNWRGVKKHSRLAHPDTNSDQRRTDGWRAEDREDVRHDFELASRYYLRGQHTVSVKSKARTVNVDGPYLRVSFVSERTLWHDASAGEDVPRDEHVGVFFAPGDWINSYEEASNYYLAEIDRRVFQLNPQNDKHELRIALYLAERWRYQAHHGRYADPLVMSELLRQSVIQVDRNMLTSRFAPRIEQALENLRERGIIGSCECLTPVDKSKGKWGSDWLASRWRILPPDALVQSYIAKSITKEARQLPPERKHH